jgi:hypothetical protein
MTESADQSAVDRDGTDRRFGGDPSHELFGRGWSPEPEVTPGAYVGRHRAPDPS